MVITEQGLPRSTPLTVADSDRQFSFEVRRLDFEAEGWRERLGGRLKPLGKEADARGWLIDGDALSTLLSHLVQRTPKLKSECAPKVTTFEGAHAIICFGGDKMKETEVESTIRDFVRDPKRRLPGGLLVDLVGRSSPVGTQLSVDLRDSEIPVSPGKREEGRADDGPTRAPEFADDLHVISYEIPEGSSLLVSLGHHDLSVGLRSVTRERLVVITPRRILIEREENELRTRATTTSTK